MNEQVDSTLSGAKSAAESVNVYMEYLDNINQINLVVKSADQTSIDQVNVGESNVELTLNPASRKIHIVFEDFILVKQTFENSHPNQKTEQNLVQNIYRFKIRTFRLPSTPAPERHNEFVLNSLRCSSCNQNLLAATTGYSMLNLPENDSEELAENFFCHMHDHSHEHEHGHITDLTEVLNPLRHENVRRKSVLINRTVLILNQSHLDLALVKTTHNFDVQCSTCNFNVGYQARKRTNEYHIWKSNVRINERSSTDDILADVTQGRYLIETREQTDGRFIYMCVLKDDLDFRRYSFGMNETCMRVSVRLNERTASKKVMFKVFSDKNNTQTNDVRKVYNDPNVESFTVSIECFSNVLKRLLDSSEGLCEGLKDSNGFHFAII